MVTAFSTQPRLLIALALVLVTGCGGGATDPFERVRVHGTATVAGAPVAHGILRLTGEKKGDLAANLTLTIKDGRFDSETDGLPGMTAGSCSAEVHQYKDAEGEVPLGTWTGTVAIPADGAEINVEVPEGALDLAPRAT